MDIVNIHFQKRKKDQTRNKEWPGKLSYSFFFQFGLPLVFVCLFVFQCSPNKDKSEGLIDPYSR